MTIYKMIPTGEKHNNSIGLEAKVWREMTYPYVVLKDGVVKEDAENASIKLTEELNSGDLEFLNLHGLLEMDAPRATKAPFTPPPRPCDPDFRNPTA